MQKARICWRSKVTGIEGRGNYVLNPTQAQELAEKSNKDFPEIEHWIETAEIEAEER